MVDELGEPRAVPQMRKHLALYLKGIPGAASLRERIMRLDSAAETLAHDRRDDRAARARAAGRRIAVIEERELYGAASPAALATETYENYKRFVNPPLARVMKLSGSPVEVRARGCTIWDHTGKPYLDFAGGYGVFTLGYSHPRVVEAVRAQLELIALSGKTMFNVLLGRAARRLAELAPGELQISFWCNSGTEAIEGAIKLARAATGRAKIVSTHRRVSRQDARRALGQRARKLSVAVSPAAGRLVLVPYGDSARWSRRCRMRRPSSSSPFKAKAASTSRPRGIWGACARRAIEPARYSLRTRSRPVLGAAVIASGATATASCPT